ncbi:MAG TPA: hypothetical protein VIR98_03200 [Candidatus Paceibacterota bacterium]|jgi:hypothetical protein
MESQCLTLISAGKVKIAATKGTEILASANDVFNSIDPNFKNWGCDKAEQPTREADIEVYEQVQDADYQKIFGGFGQNLDRLCLTTPQIKSFVVNNAKDYMLGAEGWTYFRFLFMVGNEFFIADVRIDSHDKRDVRVRRFTYDGLCYAEHRHRIVVPRLSMK